MKPEQPNLFHVARQDSPFTQEMLRRNGGVREVSMIRQRNNKRAELLHQEIKTYDKTLSVQLPRLKRMPSVPKE